MTYKDRDDWLGGCGCLLLIIALPIAWSVFWDSRGSSDAEESSEMFARDWHPHEITLSGDYIGIRGDSKMKVSFPTDAHSLDAWEITRGKLIGPTGMQNRVFDYWIHEVEGAELAVICHAESSGNPENCFAKVFVPEPEYDSYDGEYYPEY